MAFWRRFATSVRPWRSMGTAYRSRNAVMVPSRPGLTASMIDHSSASRFSIGVPVSASRWPASIVRTARAARERLFFTSWASSSTRRW